ncbi:P-II family nitrogen regulator [Ralstonia thomasii]|uniref:P-II family nitrogen regulator n=1 Tax=uncultured Ralstonia sp. TaxID=114715 RepID=UPI002627A28C|nr:transcriptional regulator [uncultured Ralstonia sp.]
MNGTMRKLLTIITEAALESILIKEIEALGARGYTITDARGKGRRGPRDAAWDESSNIRIEILCDAEIADAIARHLWARYYDDYGMVLFVNDVSVLRPEKF